MLAVVPVTLSVDFVTQKLSLRLFALWHYIGVFDRLTDSGITPLHSVIVV